MSGTTKRTVGTQTPMEFLKAAVVAATSPSTSKEVEVEKFPRYSPLTTRTKTAPSATSFRPVQQETPDEEEAKSPCPAPKQNNNTNNGVNSHKKNIGAAIFSPNSAANALTSLFTQGGTAANPRKCFPSSVKETSSPSSSEVEITSKTMMTVDAINNTSPQVTVTDTDTSTEEEAPVTATKAAREDTTTTTEQSPASVGWQEPIVPPSSHVKQPYNPQQHQFVPHHPNQHHHHHNASPQAVYFSNYYQEGPPPPPPSHGGGPWRHVRQGPWTPIIGGKIHPGPPRSGGGGSGGGGTPHHHHPRGAAPPAHQSFAWDPSRMGGPVMEQPGTMMYHNPYGPSPPAKDGSDPNSAVRLASNMNSLVTPTPKKPKFAEIAPQYPSGHQIVHVPPGHQIQVVRRPPMHPSVHHQQYPHHQPVYAAVPMQNQQHPMAVAQQQQHGQLVAPMGNTNKMMESQQENQPPVMMEQQPVAQGGGQPPQPPGSYSRKKKSLGVLAQSFLEKYQEYATGTEVIVDEAAQELGVERRRIYDVVNILESIQLVSKKGKNTYTWLGKDYLPDMFGKLQAQAIAEYPDDAVKFGLKSPENEAETEDDASVSTTGTGGGSKSRRGSMSSTTSTSDNSKEAFRSLAKLSQQFLQVFLVGYDILSLPQASEMIQGTLSAEAYAAIGTQHAHQHQRYDPTAQPPCLEDPNEFRRAAQRGLKTKIRRLYDIANVFLSVGLLSKVESHSGSTLDSISSNRRPNFQWAFHMSPKEIQKAFAAKKQVTPLGLGQLVVPPGSVLATAAFQGDERTPSRAEGKLPDPSQTPKSDNTGKSRLGIKPKSDNSETVSPNESNTMDDGDDDEEDMEGNDGGKDSSRFILANIHQSGGAYHASPDANLTRTVTMPTQGAAEPDVPRPSSTTAESEYL